MAAHPSFAALVGECGLGNRPVPGDLRRPVEDLARTALRGNLAAGRDVLDRADRVFAGTVTRLRARLGPPADRPSASADVRPVFHGFRPLVVPRPAVWPFLGRRGGLLVARAAGRLPPGRAHRIPPGRSSPGAHRIRQHGGRARRAARRTGDRPGEAGRRPCGADLHGHGPDVLTIVPHDWPFPRTAAVVHHAGAGTTAAGLRAGLPAVPVPVMADQPFCASRLHALGVAQRPVPFRELTAGGLGDAITACLSEPSHRRRAAGLARGIATEDGAATLLAHIGSMDPP